MVGHAEQVTRIGDADYMVQSLLEHRHARIASGHQQAAQLFERCGGGNGYHVRPRSHNFTRALVSKFHHLLDQLRVAALENALFFPGLHQRLEAFLGGGTLPGLILVEMRHGDAYFQQRTQRPDQVAQHANHGNKRLGPAAPGARQQKVGNEMKEEKHLANEENGFFEGQFPASLRVVRNPHRSGCGDKHQSEIGKQAEIHGGWGALELQQRLDFLHEDVEVGMHAACGHTAELDIDAVEPGDDGKSRAQSHHADADQHHDHARTSNLARRRRSRRSISPWSVS